MGTTLAQDPQQGTGPPSNRWKYAVTLRRQAKCGQDGEQQTRPYARYLLDGRVKMAVAEGFEPSEGVTPHTLSRRAP